MGLSDLCGDGCPQQLFGCPFSLPPMDGLRDPDPGSCCPSALVHLQSPPSLQSSQWAGGSPPSCHDDYRLPGSCFYQLHMRSGPFVSEGPDCDTAGGGTGSPHGLQVEFSLPSASPPSSSVLPSHFQAFGSLLCSSPVQHPRSLTQWRDMGNSKLSGTLHGLPCVYIFWSVLVFTQGLKKNQDKKCIYLTWWKRKDLLPVLGGYSPVWTRFLNWDTWTLCPLWNDEC